MNKEEFVKEVENLDIKINEKILKNLDEYFNLLNEWNKKFNLTRIVEEKEVYLKHFYDSLAIQKSVNMYDFSSLIDVGTGAGFPGMVLAIFFSNLKVTLLEANTKKCLFLQKVKEKLNLDNVEIINERSEKYAKTNREKYDIEVVDKNIDFRRVQNLKVYFENNAISLTTDVSKIDEWQGGDIVVFRKHIGIVSDSRNSNGIPFVIHHANPFQLRYEEDILTIKNDIVGHFRIS